MGYYLLTAPSATRAQKLARLLMQSGIAGRVRRLPTALSSTGCAYAVQVGREHFLSTARLLHGTPEKPRHCYYYDGTTYREVLL